MIIVSYHILCVYIPTLPQLQYNAVLTAFMMLQMRLPCSIADEDVFGPTVDASCHNGFDFTLLFEELVLTLLPIIIT